MICYLKDRIQNSKKVAIIGTCTLYIYTRYFATGDFMEWNIHMYYRCNINFDQNLIDLPK